MSANTRSTTMDQLASKGKVEVQQGTPSGLKKVGHFVRHTLEMCAAMCIGMVALDPVYVWAAGLVGYDSPHLQLPELTALVLAFNMTLPMVAWMRFRGMSWRHINEMSAAMVVEAVLIIAAYWLGILDNTAAAGKSSLWHLQHGLMMPAMIVPMLFRLDVYTREKCH